MSVFLDTGLYYALQNQRATQHDAALSAFNVTLSGTYGTVYTSDYVFDETVTLVLSRTGRHEEARTVGQRILGHGDYPDAVDMLFVGRETFRKAIDVFERYDDQQLSFTDAATVALTEHHDIDHVLSFDDDFDGLVERLDPAEL